MKLAGLVALGSRPADPRDPRRGPVPARLEAARDDDGREATFLSPLDPVMHDRERTRRLFDFDYKWEVYDKPEKRKYGYYSLPILWGDRLVARMDTALDRATATLVIKGLWLEDETPRRQRRLRRGARPGHDPVRPFLGASASMSRLSDRRRSDARHRGLLIGS